MTDRTKKFVRDFGIFIAAALGALGFAAKNTASFIDHRFVHSDSFAIHRAAEVARDSARTKDDSTFRASVLTKLDSTNLRLTQIICGERIGRGCR